MSESHFASLHKHRVFPGNLLIAALGEKLPRACIAPNYLGPAIVKADCIRFKANAALVSNEYLLYALNSPQVRHAAATIIHGVGRPRLNQSEIKSLPIPLAAPGEQDRIVAEIEKQFSRLDAGIAALERLQAHLRRYRAAVLAGAFPSGDLPSGWKSMPVEQAMTVIDYRGRTPPYAPAGIPHLRSSNVKRGDILWEDLRYVTEETYRKYMTRGIPVVGDVLLTTEAPLGEAALVPPKRFSLAQRMMVLRPDPKLLGSKFLRFQLMSGRFQALLQRSSTGSTVTGISSRNFRSLSIPVPPLHAQGSIVESIEAKLSVADAVESEVLSALRRSTRLKVAILRSAFDGSLVAPVTSAHAPAA